MNNRYYNSNRLIKDALRVIPLGSQTFSKSITAFPRGVSPLFIEKGLMAKVWDVDGNEYLDFINGLASVTMGYSNDEINSKVVEQLDKGVIFSLPNKVEIEVAKIIIDLVPSVDMVRFGKNGTDVTSAAIRLARAHTGRDHVLVCGYHGWQDWYIGSTTRNLGVPDVVKKLTHKFEYNNIQNLKDLFEKYKDKLVVIINGDIKEDFYMPYLFQNIIVSNSTFCWWSVFLNSDETKKIYLTEKGFWGKNYMFETSKQIKEKYIKL